MAKIVEEKVETEETSTETESEQSFTVIGVIIFSPIGDLGLSTVTLSVPESTTPLISEAADSAILTIAFLGNVLLSHNDIINSAFSL